MKGVWILAALLLSRLAMAEGPMRLSLGAATGPGQPILPTLDAEVVTEYRAPGAQMRLDERATELRVPFERFEYLWRLHPMSAELRLRDSSGVVREKSDGRSSARLSHWALELRSDEVVRKFREAYFQMGVSREKSSPSSTARVNGSGEAGVTQRVSDGRFGPGGQARFEGELEKCFSLDSARDHEICGQVLAVLSAGFPDLRASGEASLRYQARVSDSARLYLKPASVSGAADWNYVAGDAPAGAWMAEAAAGIALDP